MKTNEIIENITSVEEAYRKGDVDKQVFEDTIESLQFELNDKLDAIAYLIDETDKDLAVLNHEKEKYDQIKSDITIAENKKKSLKRLLGYLVFNSGEKKIRTDNHIFGKRSSESVEFSDKSLIPDDYYKVTVKREVSRSLIKDAIKKQNKKVPGAYIATNYTGTVK